MEMKRLARVAVVAAAVAGTVLGASGTAGANGVLKPVDNTLCAKPTLTNEPLANGLFPCGHGFNRYMPKVLFSDGTIQVFGIGTDFGVWTRWWGGPNGGSSNWVSLGGLASTGSVMVNAFTDSVLQLEIIGTNNGRHMFNNRNAHGTWSGWFR
ncbi:hypothetical protein ACFVFS_00515 [Kitasatospora sp. NPDC057692]|uniref:hypothetical protein n=1 Tax=Kitasatospora sp. NPDC057692 TaxID=3346215 RepID=UPI00369D7075